MARIDFEAARELRQSRQLNCVRFVQQPLDVAARTVKAQWPSVARTTIPRFPDDKPSVAGALAASLSLSWRHAELLPDSAIPAC